MSEKDASEYFVVPLSVQKEGNEYLVGNAELDEFYQFPEEGVRVIELLRQGSAIADIQRICAQEFGEEIDVEGFIELLMEAGFVYRDDDRSSFESRVTAARDDGRLLVQPNAKIAQAIFSRWSLVIYLAVVGYALFSAIQDPRLRLNLSAFYLESNFTLTLVSLLVLYSFTVMLHESGHILAAARYGLASRLGFGNRLWAVVAEADLTAILTLPKRKRYLPLLAGMLVDVLTISLLTILIGHLLSRGIDGYIVQILQALVLQVVITISWQFNVFLRTDLYYVVCNYFSYPNLDGEARIYLRDRIFSASAGLFGAKTDQPSYHDIAILRAFTALWVAGRVMALLFLVFVFLPTLWRYIKDAYAAIEAPSATSATAFDLSMFALLSVALFSVGMFMWLRRK